MARKLCVVAILLALIVVMGDTTRAQDARSVLQAAVRAMGGANVKTIQYSGTGWNAGVGQSFSPEEDWPRFEVTRYTRTIDYDARSSREELTRRQGNNPPRGGGGTPLDLLLTPHGFLRAALAANNPTAISLTLAASPGAITQNGKATLVSFTAMGK